MAIVPHIPTVVFEIINFLALTALLYYLLFRPAMRRVEEHAAEKERLAQELEANRQAAAQARAEWEARLAHADQEAAEILAQAKAQAEAERADLLNETQAEVERILAEAQVDIHRLRVRAMEEFSAELLDVILEVSGSLIERVAPADLHDALVQQLNDRIWELGRSEMQRVEMLRRSLGDRTPTVAVQTARPLTTAQQGALVRTFTALADRNVNLEVRVVAALGIGLNVRIGDLVVDNSIAGKLAQLRDDAVKELKEKLHHE